MENRPQWGTRTGFILAAVGSAVGLGNIWRFPAVAYENGGGAFFLPYLFALLTAGIPILILEFTIGHKFRASAPGSWRKMNKKWEWIGWWQLAIAFVISIYYATVVAWAMAYTFFSLRLQWGRDTEQYFFGDYLKIVTDPGQYGGIVLAVFIPQVIVWTVTLFVLYRGVKKGIEATNKVMLPALLILFFVLVVRAVTLEGAVIGLNDFFKPNWHAIFDGKVWVAAYGQIFFSLSIGFAIMVTYASYLSKNSDITNNAFITGFANAAFELLAGIGVFSILGFMALQQGVEVDQVVSEGVGLAFIVFPQIMNELPVLNALFGFIFFGSLVLAGLSSQISIVETFVAGVQEKFGLSRSKSVLLSGGLAAVLSLIFSTRGGLYFLDVVDYFINNFGIALVGLMEVIVIAWFTRQLKPLQAHADAISDIKLGVWWRICLGVLTPLVLGYMMLDNIRINIESTYENYETWFVSIYGWGVVIVVLLIGIWFSMIGRKIGERNG